ncbi:MAG: hypothetical protein ACI4WS_07805 [Oscillospiraceae bacterium]
MDNIEDILRALAEDPPNDNGSSPSDNSSGESGGGGTEGLFSGLDFNTIAKAASLMSAMGTQNDDERLLLALKPLLREENQAKVDTAIKLLKLVSLLPLLRESGLFGN